MQTFLPYADYVLSAKCLDYKRLGKQRSEVLTILNGGWVNHPCSVMWRGYEWKLCIYGLIICAEWIHRGYNDTVYDKLVSYIQYHDFKYRDYPPWFGDIQFHESHQSNLVRKSPEHYRKYFPDVADNLPYIWSV